MTKIEPPLVEGEWVKAEREWTGASVAVVARLKTNPRCPGGLFLGPFELVDRCGDTPDWWTVVERRPPVPDWAQADAILVYWERDPDGSPVAYARCVDGTFMHLTVDSFVERLQRGEIRSIHGLYLPKDPHAKGMERLSGDPKPAESVSTNYQVPMGMGPR